MKPVVSLLLAAAMVVAPAAMAQTAAKPDLEKGQAIATQVCAACHTFDGSRGAPANPILQGQHPEYLVKQLAEFKSGKRPSPVMQGFASMLSEDDMRNVSAFYASKQAEKGAATQKDLVRLGESIYRGGIASKQVPACAACHSPTGAGIPAQYPRIGSQHGPYVEAQMVAFRDGKRPNSSQMVQIAAKMSDREIKAVSDYVAGLR
ncbi:c-type cytochrome [Caldimonas tepidiphila]|uniref:c-type cytochrome n=1 Tax=Caldimonas tepidiphila TaxID=2315841 RepID=UPI000E5C1C85|nr:c-type cytochrome [Caldimonas tepidiphila]